jgi:hypothetical protein
VTRTLTVGGALGCNEFVFDRRALPDGNDSPH